MVSRDTQVQIGAVALGVALLLGWSLVDGSSNAAESGVPIADTMLSLGVTFVVLAGSHLYLASRGEGGGSCRSTPDGGSSRWSPRRWCYRWLPCS